MREPINESARSVTYLIFASNQSLTYLMFASTRSANQCSCVGDRIAGLGEPINRSARSATYLNFASNRSASKRGPVGDRLAGLGDPEDRLSPTSVADLAGKGISAIACGAEYSVALSASEQRVYSWGWCVLRSCVICFLNFAPPNGVSTAACSTELLVALSASEQRVCSLGGCVFCPWLLMCSSLNILCTLQDTTYTLGCSIHTIQDTLGHHLHYALHSRESPRLPVVPGIRLRFLPRSSGFTAGGGASHFLAPHVF